MWLQRVRRTPLRVGTSALTLAVSLAFIMSFSSTGAQELSECGVGFKQGAEKFVQVQYSTKNRKGAAKQIVTEAEVLWQPQEMLEDPKCYDLTKTSLFYKPQTTDSWEEVEEKQRPSGMFLKWKVDGLKPCLQYQFQIKVVGIKAGISEAMFELPQLLGPASEDEILESGFSPEAVTDFGVKVGANSATITWSGSDCASNYEVSLADTSETAKSRTESVPSGETKLNIGDLKPCTRYEATINAVLGEEYSNDLTASFATKPRLDAASNLKPTFITTLDSVSVSWESWQSVSCIDSYQVTICHKESKQCQPPVTVSKTPNLPTISFSTTNLDSCTAYTFEIQPVYPDTKIDKKVFEFKTKSPQVDTLAVNQVSARTVSTNTMQVSWLQVQCAVNYRVYQKATDDSSWRQVADTPQLEIPVDNITPCTKYHFAISAILDSGEETDKSIGPEMISDLDESDAFEAPNLYILNADKHADVSWGHADCISSYIIKVCPSAYTDCFEASVNPTDYIDGHEKDRTIRYKIENLEPCTLYTLEIIPVIPDKIFTARSHEFTTTNGIPQPPTNFKVSLKDNEVDLSWSEVQCATGYKIYQKIGQVDSEVDSFSESVHGLSANYDNLMHCENYIFAVSTLVAEQESIKTDWNNVIVPPKVDEAPELKILNNENDNITLRLDPSKSNERCKIDEYELTYSSDGGMNYYTKNIFGTELADAKDIVLSFVGATSQLSIVRGRVRYSGSEEWSLVISTHEPGDQSPIQGLNYENGDSSLVVPIVVGCLVAIVIFGVIAFFVIKRRRNQNLYDTEKAETISKGKMNGNAEETQKLNADSDPVA